MQDDLEFIKRSEYRIRILKTLDGEVKMPSVIAQDADILHNHISNMLATLRKRGFVECINPEVKKGRLYRLTPKGEEVVKKL